MNLDKGSASQTDAPLAPPEWTMELKRDGVQFTAAVSRAGKLMCKFSAFGTSSEEPAIAAN